METGDHDETLTSLKHSITHTVSEKADFSELTGVLSWAYTYSFPEFYIAGFLFVVPASRFLFCVLSNDRSKAFVELFGSCTESHLLGINTQLCIQSSSVVHARSFERCGQASCVKPEAQVPSEGSSFRSSCLPPQLAWPTPVPQQQGRDRRGLSQDRTVGCR